MKKIVYFVRHGEAENNVNSPIYRGHEGVLTDTGKEQAIIVADRISRLPIEYMVASTMTRAHFTAEAISHRTGLQFDSSDLFAERKNPSSFVGMNWHDPETRRIDKKWLGTLFVEGERYLDGENFADIKDRARSAFSFLEKRTEENILVVTHGFFLRVMLAYIIFGERLTALEFTKVNRAIPHTKNTHITVFRFDERDPSSPWKLWVWNDHAHLG